MRGFFGRRRLTFHKGTAFGSFLRALEIKIMNNKDNHSYVVCTEDDIFSYYM